MIIILEGRNGEDGIAQTYFEYEKYLILILGIKFI